MPFSYRIDPDQQIGRVVWHGHVTAGEIIEAMDALFGHPAWQPGFRHCWDGRAISELVLGLEETGLVLQRLREVRSRMGRGRAATINPKPVHWFGARMLIIMSRLGLPEVRVCTTLAEAAEWLDVPVETLEEVTPQ